jgi:hypothetical protein
MNRKQTIALLGATLLLSSSPAWTQEQADEDPTFATIRLMSNAEAELPEEVIKKIKLPDNLTVDSEAVANSARGLATANQNRLEGNKGLEQAEEAQQSGADMMDSAQEDRENRGRSDDRRGPPDNPGPGSQ